MVAAHRPKSPDKQEVCRKVAALLKKAYSSIPQPRERPVLETLLFAVCLENATVEQADAVYARVLNAFHDLNEVRVSSITELQAALGDLEHADWRALRIKNALQYVFETNYAFDFESLKRKTADLAAKQLSKISGLSYFPRAYVLQHCLGSHVLPIDSKMFAALVWLGLAERESGPEQAAEALRPFGRTADAGSFCHWLHCLAADHRRQRTLAAALTRPVESDKDALARLQQLLSRSSEAGRTRPSRAGAKSGRNGNTHPRTARARLGAKKRR
ncbi:MAG: hypothetical protein ACT4QC_12770 [Planctomycetaceae bacterium]